jgi:hypothetical protein
MGLPYVSWDYFMPQISGSYYLVMYIDKGNSSETNQTNNVFYVTQTPKFFTNGYSNRKKDSAIFDNKYKFENLQYFRHNLSEINLRNENLIAPYRKLSNKEFRNAYTSDEIISFLKYKIKNGGL